MVRGLRASGAMSRAPAQLEHVSLSGKRLLRAWSETCSISPHAARRTSTSTTPTSSSAASRTTRSALLRAEAPVYFHEEPRRPGLLGGDQVRGRRHRLARTRDASRRRAAAPTSRTTRRRTSSTIQLMMLNMDPPQHTKFRRLVSQGFTPRMIAQPRAAHPRRHARDIVDRIAARGRVRLRHRRRRRAAAAGHRRADGRPAGGPPQGLRLVATASSASTIPSSRPRSRTAQIGGDGDVDVRERARRGAQARKPRDDLVSVLMNAEVDGEQLTEMEFDAFFLLLARRRQRDDAQPDLRRHARAHRAPRAARAPARRPVAASRPRSRRCCAG